MRGSIRFILLTSLILLPSLPAVAQTETPAKPSTLDELLKQVRRGRAEERATNERREAEFLAKKQEQQRLLREAIETAKREERRSEELEKTFSDNELQIAALEELLKNRLGNLGELFGVVRQVAGDTRGVIEASLSSAQIKGRSELLEKLAQSKELPTIEELKELWFALQLEATESGRVARFEAMVVTPDGDQVKREVVRAGIFTAVSDGKFLRYLPETGTLAELGRQPARRHLRAAGKLERATEGLVAMSIDPSRGSILGLLVQTPSLLERVDQGGLIGYIIVVIAFAGLLLVIGRMLILARVAHRVRLQKQSAKGDPGNPLGRVLAVYEANQEMNSEALELKLDEAILKETPPLERGLTTIKVLSVIAPLLGLLGTVTGMIRTFQAITLFGTGDPKLMAGGISQALVTTVLGLLTAIPLVLLHSLVRDRSKALTQLLDEQAAGLVAERAEREGERGVAWLVDAWAAIEDFLNVGGNVLILILVTTFAFWTLIIERYWYLRTGHPKEVERVVSLWRARGERRSWHAHQIRRALISRVSLKLNRSLGLIQTLVALCPLLGLLGTVTGMIEVFEVMAMLGSGNPRAMASGVSRATIPTMAGMVAALSGLYFSVTLQKVAQREVERTADLLTTE